MFPVPLEANPIAVLELVHEKVPPGGLLTKVAAATTELSHNIIFEGTVTVGVGLTVIVAVLVHPLLSVKVIVLEPAVIPVTSPVFVTDATPVLDETHGADDEGVPVAVSCVVPEGQSVKLPEMVGGFMVTVTVALPEQPCELVPVTV